MSLAGAHCLVTGAGGFIGSHLAEHLVGAGARVRALVHYNALGRAGWLDSSPCRREMDVLAGDITDRDSVRAAVEGVDVVFHLAALIAIPYSYRAPESYVRTNVAGTLNLLQAARAAGVRRVVHTSTSEVYGTARSVPIAETHALQGQSPYSASKIGADKMAEAMHLSFGLPVVTVRPFNTYGPRQSARAVIPAVMSQCLAEAPRIKLGSPHPTRDLSFVSDTVRGFMLAGSCDGAVGHTINLGTGREISIGKLVELIMEVTGRQVEIELDPERLRPEGSEVDRLLADNRLATELLGWRPEVSLADGLTRTAEWMSRHLDLYRPDVYHV